MSTQPNARLEELWTDLPVGTPPLDDIVRNGTVRRRRRRLAVVGGTLALTLTAITGVSVASAVFTPTRQDNQVAAAPTTPAGTRLVGMNGVAVAVPADWPTSLVVDDCGLPVEDGAWFAHQIAPIDRCGHRPQVVSVMFAPLDSEEGRQADRWATRSSSIDGTVVRTEEFECPASARCPDPDSLPAYVVVPSQGVTITLTAPPKDRALLYDIASSIQILDTGWTTVPFVDRGTFATWRSALTDNGLMPNVIESPCGPNDSCINPAIQRVTTTEPAAGEVVTEGSMVTLYGPGAWTDDMRVHTFLGPNPALEVGESAPMNINLHCGLRYVRIGEETWETARRGQGSAPFGWPDLLTGTAIRASDDTVLFTSPRITAQIVFHPANTVDPPPCY